MYVMYGTMYVMYGTSSKLVLLVKQLHQKGKKPWNEVGLHTTINYLFYWMLS